MVRTPPRAGNVDAENFRADTYWWAEIIMWNFPFFPEQASTFAWRIDSIYFVLSLLSLIFIVPIAILIVYFTIHYRRGKQVNRSKFMTENLKLEASWSLGPFVLAMGIFGWAAVEFFDMQRMPADTLDIYIVGKQWMWHAQHPSGKGEINELHVPIDRPVKLIMTSQDVIHSFYIPAFRVKQDVLPGRYTTMWFEPSQEGEYHLFCAEYCGTEHSRMGGRVVVLSQLDYQRWLSGDTGESLAEAGARLFEDRGCASCHNAQPNARGPSLVGLFEQEVALQDGRTVIADEAYLRESILEPQAKIVDGYGAIMPTYAGQLSEEALVQLIAYIKSLTAEAPATDAAASETE